MAVVGHWLPAFLLAYALPDASATLFCKLAMLSDVFSAIFVLAGVERAGIYMDWMATPPPGTSRLIGEWKKAGVWDRHIDRVEGEDSFKGWVPCCFPVYADLSYSHTVEFMAILAVPVAAYACVRWRKGLAYALAVLLIMVSHPLMDMLFHDAYFLMGNRSNTRVSIQLWQMPWNGPFTFTAETLCAYGSYRLWLSAREPASADESTSKAISGCQRQFWQLALGHNMISWYVAAPSLAWLFYRFAPQWEYMADNTWSYVFMAITIASWSLSLYPLYKLEALTVPIKPDGGEAPYVDLKV
mmetsp:Transcript_42171/g.131213  ORF Transcript_42171/g.131213 Transcript_42171/m.131213 type:complete len:299 (-) Transcript_42171:175-1071(-)